MPTCNPLNSSLTKPLNTLGICLLLGFTVTACQPQGSTEPTVQSPAAAKAEHTPGEAKPPESLVALSQSLSKQLGGRLKAELTKAMAEGGPEAAVEVCHQKAPEIAKQLSAESGAKVGRVSLKYRNLANKPTEKQAEALKVFEQSPFGTESLYFEDKKAGMQYLQAIKTDALCLTCHGDNIAPSVQKIIAERYPNDLAIGYSLGQVRGAFTVEWPADSSAELGIKNIKRLNESLWVGGQPNEQQLAQLKELGIGTIINLRTDAEGTQDEAKQAEALGMKYQQLPIAGAQDITVANSKQLAELLKTAEQPVFLHCASGNRVGALLGLIANDEQGLSSEDAVLAGQVFGMTSLTDALVSQLESSSTQ